MAIQRWKKNNYLLFVLAVFLAWPTFGISFLVLLGWIAWTGYSRAQNAAKRDAMSVLLESIFDGDTTGEGYENFIIAVNLPFKDESISFSEIRLKECGRLVMLYFVHNPREASIFIEARKVIDPDEFVSPSELLQWEDQEHRSFIWGYHSSDLRLVCFRAVKALMTNNDLPCFEPFDLEKISTQLEEMSNEQKAVAKRAITMALTPSEPMSNKTSVRLSMEVPHKSQPFPESFPSNRRFRKASPSGDRTDPDHSKTSESLEDYIAARDAENGTNMGAWLNLGDGGTPKTSFLSDNSQAIIDEINAKAHARSQGRMEAVRDGAPPRTESEHEYARKLSRKKRMVRKL